MKTLLLLMTWCYLYSVADSLGTTFYVDFSTGSDANDGQMPTTAWKHCPGDANATGNAKRTMQAGDTYLFRGGIRYRGQIVVNGSGTSGSPITIKGDGWGAQYAIVDGSEPINAKWLRCADVSDCWGNTNWASIWVAAAPTNVVSGGMNAFTLMSVDDKPLRFAQDPNSSDALYWDYDIAHEWYPVSPQNVTTNSLIDIGRFTNGTATYYNNSFVAVWAYGNVVKLMPITGYFPAEHRIAFDMGTSIPYSDRTSFFTIIGHPANIDVSGEYVIRTNENRIYYWPHNDQDPNAQNLCIGVRPVGISCSGRHNVVIEGFRITGINGSLTGVWSDGSGVVAGNVGNPNAPATNQVIRNNEVFNLRAAQGIAAIQCQYAQNLIVSGNKVHDNSVKSKGITVTGRNIKVVSNEVNRVSGTGIYFAGVQEGLMHGNRVISIHGTHANGISVYQDSSNVTVSANLICDAGGTMITFERSSDLLFVNNILDANGTDGRVNEWSGMSGTVRFYNNTMIGNPNDCMLMIGGSTSAVYELRNNIIDGGGAGVTNRSNNIYVGLIWNQRSSYGWTLGPSENLVTNLNSLFIGATNNDWRLRSGSSAIDAGKDLSGKSLSVDFEGKPRPQGAGWDIGAYEAVATETLKTNRPSAPTKVRQK